MLGAAHFGLILYALKSYCGRLATLVLGLLIYALGTLGGGGPLHYLLPEFYIYHCAPTPDILLVNASYFGVWAGHLWFCRQLVAGSSALDLP